MNKKEDIKKIKNRIKLLAKLINEHNIHYHQNDKPIISDREFDKLIIENSLIIICTTQLLISIIKLSNKTSKNLSEAVV